VNDRGMRIHCADEEANRLALFVHGFAESRYSESHQLPTIAETGFRGLTHPYSKRAAPIVLSASASRAGRAWTDAGTARQERGLKHRAGNETRTIPVPPVLVGLLRAHIKRFGTALDGRIFQTARGGILQDSGYNEVWDQARREALTPAQYRSPLGRRPYDLRHAAVSLWLNSGVPATEVARRAGHGVAVLLKIYAHCIDGQATAANQRIADALGTQDAEQDPGDEDDGDTEQAS
jgi:integrase